MSGGISLEFMSFTIPACIVRGTISAACCKIFKALCALRAGCAPITPSFICVLHLLTGLWMCQLMFASRRHGGKLGCSKCSKSSLACIKLCRALGRSH